jgi:hypothetical protein
MRNDHRRYWRRATADRNLELTNEEVALGDRAAVMKRAKRKASRTESFRRRAGQRRPWQAVFCRSDLVRLI